MKLEIYIFTLQFFYYKRYTNLLISSKVAGSDSLGKGKKSCSKNLDSSSRRMDKI